MVNLPPPCKQVESASGWKRPSLPFLTTINNRGGGGVAIPASSVPWPLSPPLPHYPLSLTGSDSIVGSCSDFDCVSSDCDFGSSDWSGSEYHPHLPSVCNRRRSRYHRRHYVSSDQPPRPTSIVTGSSSGTVPHFGRRPRVSDCATVARCACPASTLTNLESSSHSSCSVPSVLLAVRWSSTWQGGSKRLDSHRVRGSTRDGR